MTEDDLYLLLKPLAGGQVYPYVAPLGSDGQPSISPPWVIFSLISDVTTDVLCGQAESPCFMGKGKLAARLSQPGFMPKISNKPNHVL